MIAIRSKPLKSFSHLALTFLLVTQANSFAQSNLNRPNQVRKIFIEATHEVGEGRSIDIYMKGELEKRGFEIVSDRANATAILSLISTQEEIVLDSNEDIPPKSIYEYKLALPDKKIIWKAEVRFVSRRSSEEDYEYAARQVAEKMAKKFGPK